MQNNRLKILQFNKLCSILQSNQLAIGCRQSREQNISGRKKKIFFRGEKIIKIPRIIFVISYLYTTTHY